MDSYITGKIIKELREKKGLTQFELAESLGVSDKAVSKWETGRSYPDITLIKDISKALDVSVEELLSGNKIENLNLSSDVLKSKIYVCPVCGNVIVSMGDTVVCCHGITLYPLEAEESEGKHEIKAEIVEDEYFVTMEHSSTKEHYISCLFAFSDNGYEMKKLYPEGEISAYFKISRTKIIYAYCNKYGLFKLKIK